MSFTLSPKDTVHDGTFDVDEGTTWAMFLTGEFHEVQGNPWYSFYLAPGEDGWSGGRIVVKVTGEESDRPIWQKLIDKNGNLIRKDDEIVSR